MMRGVYHRLAVDLAHVGAGVGAARAPHRQRPGRGFGPGHGDSGVLRDHVGADGEDGLGVHAEPRHLVSGKGRV